MIIKIMPDKQKSASLKKMAEITLERLGKTDLEKYPSNTLLDYYDVIHKLLEALSLREGFKIKGDGAHRELIDYFAKKHTIDEGTRQFLQQLREYRNRISYEGFMIKKSYIQENKGRIQKLIKNLRDQEEIKDLIIARLETLNKDSKIILMGKPMTVKEMIEEIEKNSELGKKIVNVQFKMIQEMGHGEM